MNRAIATGVLSLACLLVVPGAAYAERCFGEKAQVIASGGKVHVKAGRAVILRGHGRLAVDAAGSNSICAEGAVVDLKLGGGGSSRVRLGSGDDHVLLVGTIKRTERRTIWTGLGDDTVKVTGRGNTITYLSPKKVKLGARDRDTYSPLAERSRSTWSEASSAKAMTRSG